MVRIDHHLHTSRHSPDSAIDPFDLLERARAAKLDAVVITEHDYQWDTDELADLAKAGAEMNLTVLAGAEVSAREGHFLVYGLPDLSEAPAGIALADLLALVRREHAAIIAAHPFRWDQDFEAIVAEHGPVFDALELVSNNVDRRTRSKTESLLARYPMGASGSSDGHDPHVVGCYFSVFRGPIIDLASFVAALRGRLGRPGHNAEGPLACGPVESWTKALAPRRL
jgi:predicted metal-dependent phosphoesterase TrpH